MFFIERAYDYRAVAKRGRGRDCPHRNPNPRAPPGTLRERHSSSFRSLLLEAIWMKICSRVHCVTEHSST